MIRKILKLQNIGLLQDATQAGPVELGRVTTIYADNGRGKSTLAAVFRACQLGDVGRLNARRTIDAQGTPEVRLLLPTGTHVDFAANAWTTALSNIVVFDSEFVEQNVYSGFEVRADQRQSLLEFALGSQTVQLKQKIDQLTKDIDTQTRKRTQAEKTLTAIARPYTVTQFIELQSVPNVQQEIDALRARIEAAKNVEVLVARKQPTEIASIQFDTATVFKVLKTQLHDVEEAAEALVKTHLAKQNAQEFEDWLSRGQQYLGGSDCPFCGQALGELALVGAYRSYFSKAYEELKRQVAGLESQIAKGLADSRIESSLSAAETNAARIEAWKDHLDVAVPALDGITCARTLKQVRIDLLALVAAKQKAPLEAVGSPADAPNAENAIAGICQAISVYNADLMNVSNQIAVFKEKLAAESASDLTAKIQRLEAAQKRMEPEVVVVIGEYQAAEAERKRLDGEKTQSRKQLDALMKATLQQYQTSINDLLTAFGAGFSIEEFRATYQGGEPRSEYSLRVRDRSVKLGSRADLATGHSFATTLSDADRRTLAFAFFVARLEGDAGLAKKLVILDDPVSSLDRNRRHQSIRLITDLAGHCGQLLVLSHDPHFIREFRERLSDQKPTPTIANTLSIVRVQQGYSAFAPCDIDDVCSSDYYRHHRLVANYVDGKHATNARDVAKAIRPLLEGYYHRRFPGRIPRKLMFGQIISLASQAAAGDPLANLRPVLKEMGEVNEFAGQFHHDTNPGYETAPVIDGELLGCAKRALQLIYQNG